MSQVVSALFISRKDIESYYSKPPLITWGILFPAVLMLAIYVKDPATYLNVAPGIIAMTLLFGNTSMAAIVVTFEKRSGTLQRLLLTPVTHFRLGFFDLVFQDCIVGDHRIGGALWGPATIISPMRKALRSLSGAIAAALW